MEISFIFIAIYYDIFLYDTSGSSGAVRNPPIILKHTKRTTKVSNSTCTSFFSISLFKFYFISYKLLIMLLLLIGTCSVVHAIHGTP